MSLVKLNKSTLIAKFNAKENRQVKKRRMLLFFVFHYKVVNTDIFS